MIKKEDEEKEEVEKTRKVKADLSNLCCTLELLSNCGSFLYSNTALAIKTENQEETTPSNGLPFPVKLASRRLALIVNPSVGCFSSSPGHV